MKTYQEKISNDSLWITATPTPTGRTLPFYITEAGHFMAEKNYLTERNHHDSFLFLYTINGRGTIITANNKILLPKNHAIVINCHHYHKYYSTSNKWEFMWIHFNGNAVYSFFDILYPTEIWAIKILPSQDVMTKTSTLIHQAQLSNVTGVIEQSAAIHQLLNILITAALTNEQENQKRVYDKDIEQAIKFIHEKYAQPITIDDIISEIHISKYHFIRLFKRAMGVTLYSYLMNYRINVSKTLLRTTTKSITEIALACGFHDPSNFITQFVKRTGQKPTQYRRDFY